eukprot:COSAG04_NODE_2922_length_3381_cov_62.270871_3_plen_244_part_00
MLLMLVPVLVLAIALMPVVVAVLELPVALSLLPTLISIILLLLPPVVPQPQPQLWLRLEVVRIRKHSLAVALPRPAAPAHPGAGGRRVGAEGHHLGAAELRRLRAPNGPTLAKIVAEQRQDVGEVGVRELGEERGDEGGDDLLTVGGGRCGCGRGGGGEEGGRQAAVLRQHLLGVLRLRLRLQGGVGLQVDRRLAAADCTHAAPAHASTLLVAQVQTHTGVGQAEGLEKGRRTAQLRAAVAPA